MTHPKVCPQCGTHYEVQHRFCTLDGATLVGVAPPADLVGEVLADRYLITGRLGDGGMGEVYLAEHVRMKRKCAVKVIRPALASDPDAISRFNREAENASQVSHPNVAAIYDFGEATGGLIYLAMEYVDGESLARIIEREKAIHPVRTAEIIRQGAEALYMAHSLGILHRDLKPENIMITSSREHPDLVKIVDFGIARAMTSEAQRVTRTGSVVGTPEFMSPEQFAGDVLDARSDLYSLALVAFTMLTGAAAYPAGNSKDNLIVRLTQPPRRLHDVKDLPWPEELQVAFDRALASDPADRYGSVLEFSEALSTAIAMMPASQTGEMYTSALAAALASHSRMSVSGPYPPLQRATPVPGSTASVSAAATGDIAKPDSAGSSSWSRLSPRRRLALLGAGGVAVAAAIAFFGLSGNGASGDPDMQSAAAYGADSANAAADTGAAAAPTAAGTGTAAADSVYQRYRRSLLWVRGSSGSGLGFLAHQSGIVMVPYHVVRGDSTVSVFLDENTRLRGKVLVADSTRPLAAIAIAATRCRQCPVVSAAATDATGTRSVGADVVAIAGGRVGRSRQLNGTVTSDDARSFATTVRTEGAESGAPILNLAGSVIGVSAFPPGGTNGTRPRDYSVSEIQATLSAAIPLVSAAGFAPPGDTLLPVRPRTPFPPEPVAAMAAVESMDILRRYRVSTGDFQMLVMTPPVSAWRDARARAAAQSSAAGSTAAAAQVDPIQGWSEWDGCLRDRCAVVTINVVPDRTPFLFHRTTGVLNFSRGDVLSMTLFRDGQPVEPIEVAYIPAVLNHSEYTAAGRPIFRQGVAMFSAAAFAPAPGGAVPRLEVIVVDATRPDRTVRMALPASLVQTVINDFAPYGLR